MLNLFIGVCETYLVTSLSGWRHLIGETVPILDQSNACDF